MFVIKVDQKKLFEEDFVNGLHAGLAQYNCTIWSRGSGEEKKTLVLKSETALFYLALFFSTAFKLLSAVQRGEHWL